MTGNDYLRLINNKDELKSFLGDNVSKFNDVIEFVENFQKEMEKENKRRKAGLKSPANC